MFFGEEIHDVFGNDVTHITNGNQLVFGCGHQTIKETKMASEVLGCHCADFADTQGKQEARHGCLFGFFECIQQVLGALLGHAFQPGNLLQIQRKQITD